MNKKTEDKTQEQQPALPMQIRDSQCPETVDWAIKYLASFDGLPVWGFISSQLTPSMIDRLIETARAVRAIKEG